MGRMESFVLSLARAILAPLGLFVASWWLGAALAPERFAPAAALSGIGAGIFPDAFFLKTRTARFSAGVMACAAAAVQHWLAGRAARISFGWGDTVDAGTW